MVGGQQAGKTQIKEMEELVQVPVRCFTAARTKFLIVPPYVAVAKGYIPTVPKASAVFCFSHCVWCVPEWLFRNFADIFLSIEGAQRFFKWCGSY